MIWKKPPHIAEEGSKIYVVFKHKELHICPYIVGPNQLWDHIEKWCYQEEIEEENTRKFRRK